MAVSSEAVTGVGVAIGVATVIELALLALLTLSLPPHAAAPSATASVTPTAADLIFIIWSLLSLRNFTLYYTSVVTRVSAVAHLFVNLIIHSVGGAARLTLAAEMFYSSHGF